MPEPTQTDVFLSYNREDGAARALEMERRLQAKGVRVWIDKKQIQISDHFPKRIEDAIAEAAAFVLFWTPRAATSVYVDQEVDLALVQHQQRGMPIYILKLPEAPDLPPKLPSSLHFENLDPTRMNQAVELLASRYCVRKFDSLDWAAPLGNQGRLCGLDPSLAVVPFFKSIFCQGYLVGDVEMTLNDFLRAPNPWIGIFVQTTGSLKNEDARKMVADHLPRPTLFLHVFGPAPNGDKLTLADHELNGQWCDLVVSTTQALKSLIDRRGDLPVKMFMAAPIMLGVAIGKCRDRFWRLQLFHLLQDRSRYQLVLDTAELGD